MSLIVGALPTNSSDDPDPAGPAPLGTPHESSIGDRPARWEWSAVVALLVIDAVWTALNSRDWWFTADFWHFAAREGASGWIHQHGGHLNLFNVAVARLIEAGGFDYWPVWGFVRSLFSVVIGLSAWLALRRAGTRPLIALAATVAISTFWYDVFITVVLVNIPITLTCLAFLSHLVVTGRRRWLLTVSSIGVAAGSTMVLGVVAMAIVLARRALYRPLLPWLLAPLLPYGLWYRLVRPSASSTGDLFGQTDVPATLWSIVEAGVRTYLTGVPVPALIVSALTAVLLVRQLVRLFGPTPIGVHEEFYTLALGMLLAALFRDRVLGGSPGTAPRYGYHLTYFLVMTIAASWQTAHGQTDSRESGDTPLRRWPPQLRRFADLAVLLLLIAVPLLQLGQRTDSYRWGQSRGAMVQTRVSAAGYLLSIGADHYLDQGYLPGTEGAGALQVGDLARYVEAGWRPEAPKVIERDRAQADLLTALTQVQPDAQACLDRPDIGTDAAALTFTTETTLMAVGPATTELEFRWAGDSFSAPTITVERLPANGWAQIRIKASADTTASVVAPPETTLCPIG